MKRLEELLPLCFGVWLLSIVLMTSSWHKPGPERWIWLAICIAASTVFVVWAFRETVRQKRQFVKIAKQLQEDLDQPFD